MAITLLAHAYAQVNSSGSTTAGIDTSGANLLVVLVSYYDQTAAPSFSDNKGNTWTALTAWQSAVGSPSYFDRIYYCLSPTVGTGHTFSVAGASSFSSIAVQAWSGITAFDKEVAGNFSHATSVTSNSLTPAESNELIIVGGGASVGSNVLCTIDSSFTISDQHDTIGGQSFCILMAYKIKSDSSAESPTISLSGTFSAMNIVIAAFKSVSATAVNSSFLLSF
jgi:hypothetical protein